MAVDGQSLDGAAAPRISPALAFLKNFLNVDGAVFLILLGMLVVTPYFRGLFFPNEQMVALIVAVTLFAARCWVKFSRNDYNFLNSPLDWAAFGLLCSYVVSTFVAARVRDAIQEDIKILLYFIFFWLVRELVRDDRRRAMVLGTITVTGVWLAVLGVGAAAGTFSYNGAFDGLRIYSAMQYPNTLASYLTMAFFCALALWSRAAAPAWRGEGGLVARVTRLVWPSYLWALAAYMAVFVFVFTYSRGGWLIFPVVTALFLALQPRGFRLAAALAMAATVAAVAPLAGSFAAAVEARNAGGIWGIFFLGLPVALALNAAVLAGLSALRRLTPAARAGVLAGLGAAILITAVVVAGDRLLPSSLAQRLQTTNLADYGSRSRIQWSLDALKIIRDHPILGAGGGGWDALYHEYQSYGYWSTQVHDHFMQVWVEVGTVGFLIYLGLWVLVFWWGWRAWRVARAEDDTARGIILAGALPGIAALLFHSLIDFNLTLSSLTLALWSLAAVVRTMPVQVGTEAAMARTAGRQVAEDFRLLPRVVVFGGAILVVAGLLSLLTGTMSVRKAILAAEAGDPIGARQFFEQAKSRDPFTASFFVDSAQLTLAVAQQAGPSADMSGAMAEAIVDVRRGVALDPGNANFRQFLGALLLQTGDAQNGLRELERSVTLQPYVAERYEHLASAYLAVARGEMSRGNQDYARSVLRRMLTVPDQLRRRSASVPDWASRHGISTPPSTPRLTMFSGQARAMLGDLPGAEKELNQAAQVDDRQIQAESNAWLSGVLERQGKAAEAAQALERAKAADPAVEGFLPQVRGILQSSSGER